MINQINFEKLNAVMRLFTVYVEQGSQKPDAIIQCEQKLGNDYYRELGLVKEIFFEESGSSKNTHNAKWSFFQSLKSDIAASGGNSDKALIEVSKLIKLTSPGFKACSRFYKAIYTYPMIIIVIAMLVYTQYKLFVFDFMTNAFNGDILNLP